jgi:hypothetical protein
LTDRKLQGKEVDRLLRETLSDDLPLPEEMRLRSSLRRAWAAARVSGMRGEGRPIVFRPAASMAQAALGAAAGLLLALSLALHLALPPRLVAASLSLQNASLRVASQMRRAVAMTCVLETTDDKGRPRRYHISWRIPDEVLVRVEDSSGEEPGDPRSRAVSEFLSPEQIERLLAGRWHALEDGGAEAGRATFDVARARQHVRVTIDRSTDLPLRLESGWTATLGWTLGEAAPLPLAGGSRSSGQGGSR